MQVLHLNNEKTWRGGERQTLLLAAELPRHGAQSVIACRAGAPLAAEAARAGVPVLPVGAGNPALLRDLVMRARGFDVVHCHTGRGHSVAAIHSLFHHAPLVVTRRVDFLPGRSFFNRFKFARAARVVCISGFIAQQLRAWGVPAAKLAVIPSAVPSPDKPVPRQSAGAELRRRLGIPHEKRLVGNIAAMVGHKDQATLLRAARQVANRRADVAFVVLGDGELRPQLEQQRHELQLESTVYFAGFIPEAEKLLPAFDVFAMSSAMEGLGSIVLDAFAAGVPVAATAGGGLPELVRSDETGLLAPVRDAEALASAICRLLDEPPTAAKVTARARELVAAQYSVPRMAERYVAIYKAVAADVSRL